MLENISIVPFMGFFSIGCIFFGVAMVPALVRKIGKKSTYMLGCAIWAFGDILAFLFAKDATVFIVFACFAFFGSSFVNSLNWALVSDAVEYGEWKTGTRSEGVVYSFFTLFRKLSQAIAGFIPAIVLAASGYIPNAVQSIKTISAIKGLIFIYPAALAIATIIIMGCFYKLTDAKYKEIIVILDERKSNAAL